MCFQEEESPCGEVTLKRDRSFSEHDLAQLRSEMVSGLQSVTPPPGGIEPRARAGSMHSWKPSTQDQGEYRLQHPRSFHALPMDSVLQPQTHISLEQARTQGVQLIPARIVPRLSPPKFSRHPCFPFENFFKSANQPIFIANHFL